MKRIVLMLMALLFAVQTAPMAAAAESGPIRELSVYPFIQYFTWEEFLENAPRNVNEDGVQYGIGALIDITILKENKWYMGIVGKTEVFGGVINYEGLSQSNPIYDPARRYNNRETTSDVDYFGIKQEVNITAPLQFDRFTIGPIAGIGYKWWLRDINDGSALDTLNQSFVVQGYTEEWLSAYTKIGGMADYLVRDDLKIHAEVGALYPFIITNSVSFDGQDTVIEPEGRWSIFSELAVRYGNWKTSLYYEGFRTSRSPVVSGIYQPTSEADIFGMSVGWCFR